MVLRISGYYNLEEFEVADSLLQQIDQKFRDADPRQENLLLFYDALLKGKNDLAFHYMNQEYILAPFDLQTNNTMIVLALQFINDVDKANQFYQKIPEKLMDYGNCANCRSRGLCRYRQYVSVSPRRGHPAGRARGQPRKDRGIRE